MDSNQGNNAQTRSFSFITIGQEDQDEVIQAGVTEQPQATQVAQQTSTQPTQGQADKVLPDEQLDSAKPAEPDPVSQPKKAPVAAPAKKKDAYQETTLEDLEGASMPMAQKVVLVLAAVLIVAAVVYCVAFM